MNIQSIEQLMYQISDLFLAPVLILLILLFIYSLYALGQFSAQRFQRYKNQQYFSQSINTPSSATDLDQLRGYPLARLYMLHMHAPQSEQKLPLSQDHLDVAALKELESVRTVSRLAPMLGLIATMVPMGPALKSLADGNIQGISENLIVAFSAVIFGLVIASITFWIAAVKKRWLAIELVSLLPLLQAVSNNTASNNTVTVEKEREAA